MQKTRHISLFIRSFIMAMCLLTLAGCELAPGVMRCRDPNAADDCKTKPPEEDTVTDENCVTIAEAITVDEDERILVQVEPDDWPGPKTKAGIASWVVIQIQRQLESIVRTIFQMFQFDQDFRGIYAALLLIYLVAYRYSLVLGITKVRAYQLVLTTMKVVLISELVLNWSEFNTLVRIPMEAFVNDMTEIISSSTGVLERPLWVESPDSESEYYGTADHLFSLMYDYDYLKLLMAGTAAKWDGFAYTLLLIALMVGYVSAMVYAIYVFLVAMVARALLYILAPIFITLALFRQTKSLFDNWLASLINYSLQPVFLFMFLGLYIALMNGFISGPAFDTSKKICYQEYLDVQIPGAETTFYMWRVMDDASGELQQGDGTVAFPADFAVLLVITITAFVLRFMVTWSINAAAYVAEGATTFVNLPLNSFEVQRGRSIIGAKAEDTARTFLPEKPGRSRGGSPPERPDRPRGNIRKRIGN